MSKITFALLVAVSFSGCADANIAQNATELCARDVDGFWEGLWHGLIVPFGFIGSLLDSSISLYDVCNNGSWYDLGFALGSGAIGVGSVGSAASSRRR